MKGVEKYLYVVKDNLFIKGIAALLFFLAFVPHLLYLSTAPPGLAHDEIEYQLSARTFSLQGKDLSGYWFPLNLFATETEGNVSAIPVALLSPFQSIPPQTILTARLPYLFISIATAIALYFFVQALFQKKLLSVIAALLFLINPWAFFLSRFATESPFALLFLLIGMTLLLKDSGKKLFVAFLFFFLTFFSYHGAKLIIVPVALLFLVYRYNFPDKSVLNISRKEALVFASSLLLLFVTFLGISQLLPHSNLAKRGGDVVLFNAESTAGLVDTLRKSTVDNKFSSLFINKYTIGGREVFTRYLTAFSPQVLFFEGDLRAVYGYFYHGLFYVFDGVLLVIGMIFLIKKQLKQFLFLLGIVLIAPIPSALNQMGTSYVHRSFLLLPILIIFISYGIYAVTSQLKRFIPLPMSLGLIGGILLLSYAQFLHFYFFLYPVTSGEFYALDNRIMAHFITISSSKQPIEIYTSNPRDAYTATLYYLHEPQLIEHHLANVATFNSTDHYRLRNVVFTYGCPEEKKYTDKTTYIIANDRTCLHGKNPVYTFNNPKDAGPMFYIYNASFCSNLTLERWRRFKRVTDYQIEEMPQESFCQTWVSPY